MSLLSNVIRTPVISALGAKLARGRSPIVVALLSLLVSRALASRQDSEEEAAKRNQRPQSPQEEEGLGGLVEQFRRGGLEDLIRSWIGTGTNKPISPDQLQLALGPEKVDQLANDTGLPREDLLSSTSSPPKGSSQRKRSYALRPVSWMI
jgi:uncharacterized protein YidB (DUF937 family)